MTLLNTQRSNLFPGFCLLNDAFQKVNVCEERFAAGRSQGAGRQRLFVMEGFGYCDVASLLEGSNMNAQITVCHAQGVPDLGKRKLIRGGQQRHDGQTPLFMDDAIELEKSIGIHMANAIS